MAQIPIIVSDAPTKRSLMELLAGPGAMTVAEVIGDTENDCAVISVSNPEVARWLADDRPPRRLAILHRKAQDAYLADQGWLYSNARKSFDITHYIHFERSYKAAKARLLALTAEWKLEVFNRFHFHMEEPNCVNELFAFLGSSSRLTEDASIPGQWGHPNYHDLIENIDEYKEFFASRL